MKKLLLLSVVALSACTPRAGFTLPPANQPQLAVNKFGTGQITAVFVHGNGNASKDDWDGVMPAVAELGLTVMSYDRAGHGASPPLQLPYRLEDEVTSLVALAEEAAKSGPVILVGHSFGGIVVALAASRTDVVEGIVFVDAPLPASFSVEMAERERARYRPQFAMLRARAPQLAEAIIPRIEAFPEIARQLASAAFPERLLTVVIKADASTFEDPESIAAEAAGIVKFTDASEWHHLMRAEGSSHQVMRDRPDVVIAAVDYLRAQLERDR